MASQYTPSGGSPISFDLLQGAPPVLVEQVELYERPGLDGYGTRRGGTRSPPALLRAVKYESSEGNANTFWTTVAAAVGTTGTLVDEWNRSHGNVLLAALAPEWDGALGDVRRVVHKDGSTQYRVGLLLTVQRVA